MKENDWIFLTMIGQILTNQSDNETKIFDIKNIYKAWLDSLEKDKRHE